MFWAMPKQRFDAARTRGMKAITRQSAAAGTSRRVVHFTLLVEFPWPRK